MPLQIIFMDAGQGDATLMVHPDGSLVLVDCGSKKNKAIVGDEIAKVLKFFLSKTGNKLKALVLTHPDGDHYNLVKALIIDSGVTVGTIFYGGLSKHYAGITTWLNNHPKAIPFEQGYSKFNIINDLSFNGATLNPKQPNVEVRVLAANIGNPNVKKDANPNSIVLLVTYASINIFLMGDSTILTENVIRLRMENKLKAHLNNRNTMLKAGHHGSSTSSSKEWIGLIKPEVVFISSDTKSFSGVSLPRSTVINNILEWSPIFDFGANFGHYYVQYNDVTDVHEQVLTTKGLFTNLHLLVFNAAKTEFTAYGTSWNYMLDDAGRPSIFPAVGWDNIKKAF